MIYQQPSSDTIDQTLTLLMNCLKQRIGVAETALAWFQSYLSDRSQAIHLNDMSVQLRLQLLLESPRPRGPYWGHFYSPPTQRLWETLLISTGSQLHLYTDDIQLYLPFDPTSAEDTASVIHCLQACMRIGDMKLKHGWI